MPPLFFWRETEQPHGFLSQWYPSTFTAPSPTPSPPTTTTTPTSPLPSPSQHPTTFTSTEQYMMYHKALLFFDHATAAQILHEPNPKTQQALGRKVSGFDKQKWDAKKSGIVEEGNWWKFAGGKDAEGGDLGKRLVETGGRELVEASPRDSIWGIGFAAENAEEMRAEWGENLLGKALMRVRERLREEGEGKGNGNGEGL